MLIQIRISIFLALKFLLYNHIFDFGTSCEMLHKGVQWIPGLHR